ncbi:hypothetical protein [Nocardia sp. CA-135398]|uniref:hypothetical protein n=1 Tax=Nocardia sp. CA-135398 TaxID=3239977 RepID=UPI003D986561
MTRTDMPVNQKTMPLSRIQEPVERNSVGPFQLFNDTDKHVSATVTAGDSGPFVAVIPLAPGATSDPIEYGDWADVLFTESGHQQEIMFMPNIVWWYSVTGHMTPNEVNRVSSLS